MNIFHTKDYLPLQAIQLHRRTRFYPTGSQSCPSFSRLPFWTADFSTPLLVFENITDNFGICWPFGSGVPLWPPWHEDIAEGRPEDVYTLSLDKIKAFDINANVSIENYASLISLRAHLMMIKITATVMMVKKIQYLIKIQRTGGLLLADARASERKFRMPTEIPTTNSTNKYLNVKQLSWAIN